MNRRSAARLRIAYVSADYPLPGGPAVGGIGAHTRALAQAVASLGHEVHVITEAQDGPRVVADGAVAVHALAPSQGRLWKLGRVLPVNWLRRSLAAHRKLRALHRKTPLDIVSFPDGYGEGFAHSFSPVAISVVQLFGPASIVQRWDARAVPPLRARSERWIERRPLQRAQLVICATRLFADSIGREWALDPARMRIIRNPLDLEHFAPDAEARMRAPLVLFAGHLQRLKGVEVLANAIPRVLGACPDARFVFVGNDTSTAPDGTSMRSHLSRMLQRAGALDRVELRDPIPQAELALLYRSASVFVLPSHNDVYPNAALEALASGVPCIVTTNVGVAELVLEGDAGRVVPPGDVGALAAALQELLALPEGARRSMGLRGRSVVETHCAAGKIAAQTVDAYREAMASPTLRRIAVSERHA